ncbi:hypothetical protein JCM3765_001599 [Sporobolomyces pararoseus]
MNDTTTAARRELGLLILVILKAQHLPDPHKFSKQDPFVIAELGEGENVQTVRTQTDRGGGQHPLWDEEFRMKLYEEEGKTEGQRLSLKVMRKEGTRAKDQELIGEGSVLVDGKSWREFDEWIELKTSEGKYVGEVYVEMTFYPLEPQRRPSASNLTRHPSKLDPSSRAPVPPSLQPGSLRQSLSGLSLDDRYRQQAPAKELPTIPPAQTAQPELLPFPGDPEPSHSLPNSLKPGSGSSRPSSIHTVPTNSSESLPLPGEQHQTQSCVQRQQYPRATPIPVATESRPSLLSQDSNPSLSSSPGQISYSPLVHHQAQQHQAPSSYPFLAPGNHPQQYHSMSPHPAQPHSISYPPPSPSPSVMHSSHVQSPNHHMQSTALPVSPPPVPPRPSSAASSITEVMPGSFNPHSQSRRTPSPSPNRFSNLPSAASDRFATPSIPSLPAQQQYSPSPSPSLSQFPSASSNSRPPLPPTPTGALSTPSFVSKRQEAAQEQEHNYGYSLGPPAYQPPSPAARQIPQQQSHQEEEEAEAQRLHRLAAEREARESAERERILEEERARKERERISEEKKLARIREAQEARAKKLAQEKEDERMALEAEARERAAESERRERERQANEDFIRRLQDEEREREERERRDEEFARKMREEEEAERLRREKQDEEFIRKLREEDQRAEEEERQRRLVEDERLARSLADRENEEQERRRNRPP